MRHFITFLCFLLPLPLSALVPDQDTELTDAERLVSWLLVDERNLNGIRFAKVIEAATGKAILPVDPAEEVEARVLKHLRVVLDELLAEIGDAAHAIHGVGRINEVSGHIEDLLQEKLDAIDGIECRPPVNASGRVQRSGYPDLRLVDELSGRVFYLDPKVYAHGSRQSSFRTFYYEPQVATNKVLDDAHHIIVGIAHGGRVEDRWDFLSWNLVDLAGFRVRLKAEFQGSNRDLYRPDAILLRSESVAEEPDEEGR